MINESLAEQSNFLLYGALASYTIGFLSYSLDLANGMANPERTRRKEASIGYSLTLLAALLHLAAITARGWATQRPPWGNMYEFSTAGALVVTVIFLIGSKWRDFRYLGVFIIGPVLLTLGLAIKLFYVKADALVPALKSSWLIVHVSVAFLAASLLTIAFSFTILYLVKEQLSAQPQFQSGKKAAFLKLFPTPTDLDTMAYRLHALAFPLWSFTLIGGAIWADKSWGRYWGWDPKEVWTFVIWVVYAAYLHARATRGWAGQKAAWIAILGFICILINFLVVNVYFVGNHSYGGVG